ncbi:thiamine ABC transporter substrate-binding protein [Cardiobacteriaceae bacterium TAE3-ERU3]|nr:thiamine ABC transporter substrate-binding protein [Cardiobacteriaceae bacterium TAE3-ERU3]
MKHIILSAAILAASLNVAHAADKQLNVLTYSSFDSDWGPGPKITAEFEAQCDCTINWLTAEDSVMMLRRLQLEGDALEADVIVGLDNQSIADVLDTGLVADLKEPIATRFGDAKDAIPFDYGYLAFIKRKDSDVPALNSLNDLANASNDLTIAIEDPRTSSVGASMLAWAESETENPAEFWRNLKPKLSAITSGWSEAYSLFTGGNVDMVLSYTTSPIYHQIVEDDNNYEAILFDQPHYEQIEYAVALKHAAEPQLAEDFLHYLIKPETQESIALTNWMYPVVDGVELPAAFTDAPRPEGENLPPAEVAKDMPKWLDTWKSVILAE